MIVHLFDQLRYRETKQLNREVGRLQIPLDKGETGMRGRGVRLLPRSAFTIATCHLEDWQRTASDAAVAVPVEESAHTAGRSCSAHCEQSIIDYRSALSGDDDLFYDWGLDAKTRHTKLSRSPAPLNFD